MSPEWIGFWSGVFIGCLGTISVLGAIASLPARKALTIKEMQARRKARRSRHW